jgi:hypothetical protein
VRTFLDRRRDVFGEPRPKHISYVESDCLRRLFAFVAG